MDMTTETWETTQVLICGCGPTGALLAGYLCRMGVSNIILEKEVSIATDPRGIVLDDDGIRSLQGLGLYKHIFAEIGTCIDRVRFISGDHHDLEREPFLSIDTESSEGNTGHPGMIAHKQPALEKHLRSVMESSDLSQIRTRCTLTSIHEDKDWVYATYVDSKGVEQNIKARFLAGADGKTGFTRKNYLEPKGIHMKWAEQANYDETWVALNWKIHLPTPETHPSFPLWTLGYMPQQVYDSFFPWGFRMLCNPKRPAVCGRFGPQEDRLWRFEFVVRSGEDEMEMTQTHKMREVVFPYFTHAGSRYGLKTAVKFPEDCIEVLRARPFRFYARSCNKWSLGRVILCGDAAHVFPPFGGQGIASGFRDAISLAWRLAIACRSDINYEKLFTGWYLERKQQLERSLALTVRNGDIVTSSNPFFISVRDWTLWTLQLFPSWKRWLERGPRREAPVSYRYTQEMHFVPEQQGGVYFPQTYCASLDKPTQVLFTDDVIFSRNQANKLFRVVVLLNTLDEMSHAVIDLKAIEEISQDLSLNDAAFFVPRESLSKSALREVIPEELVDQIFRSASAEEFAQSELCIGRPFPRGYNELLMWQASKGMRYVILRPDRFVFAMCQSLPELEQAARRLSEVFL